MHTPLLITKKRDGEVRCRAPYCVHAYMYLCELLLSGLCGLVRTRLRFFDLIFYNSSRTHSLTARASSGQVLTREEIEFFVNGAVSGSIAREQIGAMLMAIFLKGMTGEETADLTRAMMHSGTCVLCDLINVHYRDTCCIAGETLSWPQFPPGSVVDKHSTGGVGDKISLPLAPALAALGLKVREWMCCA